LAPWQQAIYLPAADFARNIIDMLESAMIAAIKRHQPTLFH
jgi:hypothetical protein